MADEGSDNAARDGGRTARPQQGPAAANTAKAKRKGEVPTLTDDVTAKFLRVGNLLYRTSDDQRPIARLEPDRLKTSNLDALPDIVRIAKANGWTAIRVGGGDTFKKAAYLAAAAQGLAVENYTPSKLVKAEADRLSARRARRDELRHGRAAATEPPGQNDANVALKRLSERFLGQSHDQNAQDPELRRAQSLVAQTIAITRARYPDDPLRAAREVDARRQEIARRIASGDKIAGVQVRSEHAERIQEMTHAQAITRGGRSR